MNVLIVEDDEAIASSLQAFLAKEGMSSIVAHTLLEARTKMNSSPQTELVILDWSLPDGQGVHLLKDWRQNGNHIPVIMLTARTELLDKVLGLEIGADDYVTKPFEPRELLARITARLRNRNSSPAAVAALKFENIEINLSSRKVTLEGSPVDLTKLEFELLKLFVEHPEQAFSRDELLNRVWGFENFPTTRTVDTHILQLRQKFPNLRIETIRGIGYRLELKMESAGTKK